MKKIFLSSLFALATLSISFAHGEKPNSNDTEALRAEIINVIGHPKLDASDETQRVTVDFIINAKNEVVILSTSNSDFDGYIKSKLNYYELTKSNGVINKQYTLPLVIQNP